MYWVVIRSERGLFDIVKFMDVLKEDDADEFTRFREAIRAKNKKREDLRERMKGLEGQALADAQEELRQVDIQTDDTTSGSGEGSGEQSKRKKKTLEIQYRGHGRPNLLYKLKIMLGFFQITISMIFALDISYPNLFKKFYQLFSIFNFDFVQWSSVSCIATGIDVYIKLVCICCVPIAVIFGLVLFYLGPYYTCIKKSSHQALVLARKRHKRKFWRLVLFTLFLSFPNVSSKVLSFYRCSSVIEGERYLSEDYHETCMNDKWMSYLVFNVFAVLLYPIGIPVCFFVLLYINRKRFGMHKVRLQMGFLYDGYSPTAWWFELADMMHKFSLTSLLFFFPESYQMPLGMIVSVSYTFVILLAQPYYRRSDDLLHLTGQTELLLLMLAGKMSTHA